MITTHLKKNGKRELIMNNKNNTFGEWQPIDTAPKKNNIDVILYVPSDFFYGIYIAHWVKDHWQARCTTWIGKDLPIYWMPLPNPPEEY